MLEIRIDEDGNTKINMSGDFIEMQADAIMCIKAIYDTIKKDSCLLARIFKDIITKEIGLAFKTGSELDTKVKYGIETNDKTEQDLNKLFEV